MRFLEKTTKRLIIRPYRMDDLEARHSLTKTAFGSMDSLDDTRRWLEWTIASYQELARLYQPPYGDYVIALKDTGKVVGSVGIVPSLIPWGVFDEPPALRVSPEFGLFWAVEPSMWGRGYAPEAAQAVIDYLLYVLHVQRIVATTKHENLNSQRVMVKLGMTVRANPGDQPPWCEVVGVLEA